MRRLKWLLLSAAVYAAFRLVTHALERGWL
jgi:hypothetical protein